MSKPPSLACLSYDKWIEAFKPNINTTTPGSAFDGTMYETYGADLDEVIKWADGAMGTSYRRKVWTIVENDDGDLVIVDGYHRVNRIGYLLTTVASKAGVQYVVSLD